MKFEKEKALGEEEKLWGRKKASRRRHSRDVKGLCLAWHNRTMTLAVWEKPP